MSIIEYGYLIEVYPEEDVDQARAYFSKRTGYGFHSTIYTIGKKRYLLAPFGDKIYLRESVSLQMLKADREVIWVKTQRTNEDPGEVLEIFARKRLYIPIRELAEVSEE